VPEPTNTPPVATRRDNPDQWVSGGHEKFETPIRSAAKNRQWVQFKLTDDPEPDELALCNIALACMDARDGVLDAIQSEHHLSCLTVEESESNTDYERVEAAKMELREAEKLANRG